MNDSVEIRAPSASVGDYLKAIWELSSEGAASTKDVAGRLSVSPASVTNMFSRLREMDLVEYERYQGASLTSRGWTEALRLVRRHRLIETFLMEHLGYSWRDVHAEAERLEHTVSDEFTERLAEFLGHPGHDPHGDPIPTADGTLEPDPSFPLTDAAEGRKVRIHKVGDDDDSVLEYLGDRGLIPGRKILVQESRTLDGVVTIEDEDGSRHSFGGKIARQVFVRPAR